MAGRITTPALLEIPAGAAVLEAELSIPPDASGLVVFAHGSGSSRKSPRNTAVARLFEQGQLATLLVDLLSREEQQEDAHTHKWRFDIPLLGRRVAEVAAWIAKTQHLRVGVIGSSTGAAAALIAAAEQPEVIRAVVSRGGRTDLAQEVLPKVKAPTLLIAGERDAGVLEVNQQALEQLGGETSLKIIPGASHLFEEPDALERAASLASLWFQLHL